MPRTFLLVATLLASLAPLASAEPIQPEDPKLGRPVDYTKDVEPIFEQNCVACHNAAIAEHDFVIEDVESMFKGGKNGPSLVKGQPEKSLLYRVAARSDEKIDAMPPLPNDVDAASLTPRELGILKQWITEGAKGPEGATEVALNWRPPAETLAPVYAVALSSDAARIAVGRSNRITIHDAKTGALAARLVDPALSGDGSAGFGKDAAQRDFVHALAFSPDGTILAAGGYRAVRLWQKDVNSHRAGEVAGDKQIVDAVIATDGTFAWLAAGRELLRVDLSNNSMTKTVGGFEHDLRSVDLSADNKRLLVATAGNRFVVHDATTGEKQMTLAVEKPVGRALWNRDGKVIVAAHEDNVVRTYTVPNTEGEFESKPIAEVAGHGKPITGMVADRVNGDRVVTASEDGTARHLDIPGKRFIRTFSAGQPLTAVAVSANAQQVAVASASGTGRLWDLRNGRQLAELKCDAEHQSNLARLTEEQQVSDKLLKIAEAKKKEAADTKKNREDGLKKSQEQLEAAKQAIPEAEKKLAEETMKRDDAKKTLDAKPEDKNLQKKLDDAEKARTAAEDGVQRAKTALAAAERSVKRAQESLTKATAGVTKSEQRAKAAADAKTAADQALDTLRKAPPALPKQTSVAFSKDDKSVAVGSESGVVFRFANTDGAAIDRFAAGESSDKLLPLGDAFYLSVDADKGASLLTPYASWKQLATLGPADSEFGSFEGSPFVDRVVSLDFSRDGSTLAAGGGEPSRSGEIVLFDVAGQSVKSVFPEPHSDVVHGLDFSRDGSRIVSGSADKFVRLFDVATGKPIRSYEGHTNHVLDAAISADGSILASAGADNVVKFWKPDSGEQIKTVTNHSKQVTAVTFVGIKDEVATASGDKTVRLFRGTNGQNLRTYSGSGDYVYAVDISDDGLLVVGGGEDGIVRIWRGNDGRLLHQIDAE